MTGVSTPPRPVGTTESRLPYQIPVIPDGAIMTNHPDYPKSFLWRGAFWIHTVSSLSSFSTWVLRDDILNVRGLSELSKYAGSRTLKIVGPLDGLFGPILEMIGDWFKTWFRANPKAPEPAGVPMRNEYELFRHSSDPIEVEAYWETELLTGSTEALNRALKKLEAEDGMRPLYNQEGLRARRSRA